ncbi:hypothetical protein [Phaeobacter inhibens]|uniref:hypothetical protein n=1 Tax=Phaeobacter inhibens TaxID=221822 RepID=UPI002491C6C8|nr:hypothetical protein [Phaeobacter inhibens]
MITSYSESRNRAFENLHAKDKVRLRNAATGELLHMGGETLTRSIDYAWLGSRHQAEQLRKRAEVNGSDWPFTAIHRSLIENDYPVEKTGPEA